MPPDRRPYRRFARQLRAAHMHATTDEILELDKLERLVRHHALCVFEAQEILTDVIRAQHDREHQTQAA